MIHGRQKSTTVGRFVIQLPIIARLIVGLLITNIQPQPRARQDNLEALCIGGLAGHDPRPTRACCIVTPGL